MKVLRPLLLGLIGLFSLSACKKEKAELSIVGDWEIRSTAGGLMPGTEFPAGNGQILRFTETSYQRIQGGQALQSGTYRIVEEKFWEGNYRIIFDENLSALPEYINISDGKLTIYKGAELALDGQETVYVRK